MKPNPIPVIAVILLSCVNLSAQVPITKNNTDPKYRITLQDASFIPEKNITTETISQFNNRISRHAGKGFVVIQFEQTPGKQERELLKEQGIELLEYISGQAYTVSFSGSLEAGILQQVKARALIELTPEQKMQPGLAKGFFPPWSVKTAGTIDVWVSFPRTFSAVEAMTLLRSGNFDILPSLHTQYRIIVLRISTARLSELAALPYIEYVQPAPREDAPLNNRSTSNSRANFLTSSIGGRNLTGDGVVIGVGDNADPMQHADFQDRIINRSPISGGAHGVHVIGIAAGAGNIKERFTGFAPKATVVAQSFSSIITYASTYVTDHGMVISNNSYGNIANDCTNFGYYDLYSRLLDRQAFDLPELTTIFSAGNSGSMNCGKYAAGYGTVFSGYQSAKNILTVGATDPYEIIAPFSSKGPVQDGRIKPEIMAQGDTVWSTWSVNVYSINRGTSMSSPAISGGLALLVQRYRQLHSGNNPENALMKAILCNGATDLGNPGPDYTFGFGRMNLLRSVQMLEDNRYFTGTVALAGDQTHSISIPAGPAIHQLKVMLYWNDSAASVLAKPTLVNDLDLEVSGPSGTVLPQVLDTIPANINVFASTGVDHINNIEQVIINNPVPGATYTVHVKGTTIPSADPQKYYVAYDTLHVSTRIAYPIGGERFLPGDSVNVNWDTWGGAAGNFNLEYRKNLAGSWVQVASATPTARQVKWWIPTTDTTDEAQVRIINTGTGDISTSGVFTILGPSNLSLATIQCESYIGINWTKAAKATDYEVMILRGGEMVPVGITTDTNYVIGGLSKDTGYWVSVRPRLNGNPGMRAYAVYRQPNSGTCANGISDNDIKIDSIVTPVVSGRKYTSTEFNTMVPLKVRIKNLDNISCTDPLTFSYTINGGGGATDPAISPTILAGDTFEYTFLSPLDLSVVGSYDIQVTVTRTADPITSNNTATRFVKQLDNVAIPAGVDPVSPFLDNIETAAVKSYNTRVSGLDGLDRYDFTNTTTRGQLRSFINTGISYSGSKALTLDVNGPIALPGNTDSLTGTFNLVNFNVGSDDLRLDFRYKNHGQSSHASNKVWIRGSDLGNWIELYDLAAHQNPVNGTFKFSGSLELADTLDAHGQVFSSSTQVRWGQWGRFITADNDGGAGYTFDDIRFYKVTDDLQMLSIDTPIVNSCGLDINTRVKITIYNSSNAAIPATPGIPVMYQVDGGGWVTETITTGLAANTSMQYQFLTPAATLSTAGTHLLEVKVDYPSDNYDENDTLSIVLINQPVVTSFPYLENFESGNGSWYTNGKNNSWEYGTPASIKINRAASGSKAWKTSTVGGYQDSEDSYLYSPCFDLTGMTNPTLSLSIALDLEDCGGALCDGAYIDYSSDGITWTRLGASGQGTNWYNKSYTNNNLWSIQNYTRWHVATIPLPVGLTKLRLRFGVVSDISVSREGIGVDDIHIYDNKYGIYTGTGESPIVNQSMVNGTGWINFIEPAVTGKLIASINPNGTDLGSTNVQSYVHTGAVRYNLPSLQYYHNRNITIKPGTVNLPDSASVRFYFLDTETEALINATGCGTCYKPSMAYELGVSKYSDPADAFENGTIADDNQGSWLFINSSKAVKVPFDKGYYAEFKVKDFSEFWLNNGGFNNNTPLPIQLTSFTATRKPNNDVLLEWITSSEYNVDRFEIEVARGNDEYRQNHFSKIGEQASLGNSTQDQRYSFIDAENNKSGVRYYRLKIIDLDGSIRYSAIRPVVFNDAVLWQVYPNPSTGVFNFVYQLNDRETMTVKLYDINGRTVKEYKVIANGFMQKLVIDMQQKQFASGLYLLEASTGEKQQVFRLMKQ